MDTPNKTQPRLIDRIRGRRLAATFTLLSALSFGILAGSVLTHSVSAKSQQVDSSDARPLTVPAPVTTSNAFSKIAKEVGPAVVNINTESIPKQAANTPRRNGRNGRQLQIPNDGDNGDQGDMQDLLRRFFGGQQPGMGGDDGSDGGMGGGKREALGSGFIVDPRGYIITNNHVVDKADKIFVKLSTDPDGGPDDKGRPAHVIGVDKDTDIAVIKIDSKEPLPTVKLGNSEGAQVGDWVLAIGSPFGLSQTVSAGIVSAKNRNIGDEGMGGGTQFQRFIQTDAAINPGNSGGPLVDMTGSVIGMNTAIYTQSMGSEGVGFAMPSNTVINVYNMLISPEHAVTRGSIGIQFQSSTSPAVGRVYGFSSGILVNAVEPGSGAAKAGIEPNDVITSIDGRPIKDGDDLVNDIASRHVGSTVKLGYQRNGRQSVAAVTIGDRAKTFASLEGGDADNGNDSSSQQSDAGQSKLGITVTAIPGNTISRLGIKGGVMIDSVRPGSFADEINLTKGIIITEINRKPVTDEASYRSIVSGLKSGDDVVFAIRDPQGTSSGGTLLGGTLP